LEVGPKEKIQKKRIGVKNQAVESQVCVHALGGAEVKAILRTSKLWSPWI